MWWIGGVEFCQQDVLELVTLRYSFPFNVHVSDICGMQVHLQFAPFKKYLNPLWLGKREQGNLSKVDVIIPFFSPMYRVKISVESNKASNVCMQIREGN